MNVFFRIENIFEKINAEVDYKKISKDILSNIEKIFKNYNGEKIISDYKTQIINFIKQKKKEYIYLMQENSDNINEVIDLIYKKVNIFLFFLFNKIYYLSFIFINYFFSIIIFKNLFYI